MVFRRELERVKASRPVFFLDESGIDHRLHREYTRAPRGEKVYADVPGGRCGRTSIISASTRQHLGAPMVFTGHCNEQAVNAYFEHVLLPALPCGSVIVLDNARFHKCSSTRILVELRGCELLFLPAYSPDLNPIEHIWATFKKGIATGLQQAKDKFLFIAEMSKCYFQTL